MTPPPTTTNLFGTVLRERAPVLDTIYSSSVARPLDAGRLFGSDPVAIIIFFAVIFS
jgi:hypothetical protein